MGRGTLLEGSVGSADEEVVSESEVARDRVFI